MAKRLNDQVVRRAKASRRTEETRYQLTLKNYRCKLLQDPKVVVFIALNIRVFQVTRYTYFQDGRQRVFGGRTQGCGRLRACCIFVGLQKRLFAGYSPACEDACQLKTHTWFYFNTLQPKSF